MSRGLSIAVRRRISVTALSALLLLPVAGCASHAAHAERRVEYRQAAIAATLKSAEKREAQNPQRLEADFEFIARQTRREAAASQQNMNELDTRMRAEAERFKENQPLYREKLQQIARGKPEQIGRSAISMFY